MAIAKKLNVHAVRFAAPTTEPLMVVLSSSSDAFGHESRATQRNRVGTIYFVCFELNVIMPYKVVASSRIVLLKENTRIGSLGEFKHANSGHGFTVGQSARHSLSPCPLPSCKYAGRIVLFYFRSIVNRCNRPIALLD